MKYYKIYLIQLLIFISTNTNAQTSHLTDTLVRNVVPRLGIGYSRNFISEVGLSFVKSKFYNDKDLGFNTAISVFYVSFETMAPYNKPFIMGYKAGGEFISIGHVTSAFGLEVAYYQKSVQSSIAIFPKLGIPLINGSLSYGLGMYFNPDFRKEIGKHRITLTYNFNRKSDRTLKYLLKKYSRPQ